MNLMQLDTECEKAAMCGIMRSLLDYVMTSDVMAVLKGTPSVQFCYNVDRGVNYLLLDGDTTSIKLLIQNFCAEHGFLLHEYKSKILGKFKESIKRFDLKFGDAVSDCFYIYIYFRGFIPSDCLCRKNGIRTYKLSHLVRMKMHSALIKEIPDDMYDLYGLVMEYKDKLGDEVKADISLQMQQCGETFVGKLKEESKEQRKDWVELNAMYIELYNIFVVLK